jgi:hypothetical protein
VTVASRLWCVDSLGAYLMLREHGVTTIDEAIDLLAPDGPISDEQFNAIADGLFLYRVELEDDAELDRLDLDAVVARLSGGREVASRRRRRSGCERDDVLSPRMVRAALRAARGASRTRSP